MDLLLCIAPDQHMIAETRKPHQSYTDELRRSTSSNRQLPCPRVCRGSPRRHLHGRPVDVVDGVKVGPASRLVVAFNESTDSYVILLCNDSWESFATLAYPTLDQAIEKAERCYEGISNYWVRTSYSPAEDRRNLEEYFDGQKCSFCGALPHETQTIFGGDSAWICDTCVSGFQTELNERGA